MDRRLRRNASISTPVQEVTADGQVKVQPGQTSVPITIPQYGTLPKPGTVARLERKNGRMVATSFWSNETLENQVAEAALTSRFQTGGTIIAGGVKLQAQDAPNLSVKQTGMAIGYAGKTFTIEPNSNIPIPIPGVSQEMLPFVLFEATTVQIPHEFSALSLELDEEPKIVGVDYTVDPQSGLVTVIGEAWSGILKATLTPIGTACAGIYASNIDGTLKAELISTLNPTMPIRDILGYTQVGWVEGLTSSTSAVTTDMIFAIGDKQTLAKILYGKGITERSVADSFRQIDYSSNPDPLSGELTALYDGNSSTSVTLAAGTELIYKVTIEELFNNLVMNCSQSGKQFYVCAYINGEWQNIYGSPESPKTTVLGNYGYEFSTVAKTTRIKVVFIDEVTLYSLKPWTVLFAENIFANQIIAGAPSANIASAIPAGATLWPLRGSLLDSKGGQPSLESNVGFADGGKFGKAAQFRSKVAYRQTFEAYAVGVYPSVAFSTQIGTGGDWTVQEQDGEKALRYTAASNAAGLLKRIGVPDLSNAQIYAECKMGNADFMFCLRCDPEKNTSVSTRSFYAFRLNPYNGTIAIERWINASVTSLASKAFTLGANIWSVRCEAVGSDLRLKIWKRGAAEPTSWTLTATDEIYTSGFAGIGNYYAGTSYCYLFNVYELLDSKLQYDIPALGDEWAVSGMYTPGFASTASGNGASETVMTIANLIVDGNNKLQLRYNCETDAFELQQGLSNTYTTRATVPVSFASGDRIFWCFARLATARGALTAGAHLFISVNGGELQRASGTCTAQAFAKLGLGHYDALDNRQPDGLLENILLWPGTLPETLYAHIQAWSQANQPFIAPSGVIGFGRYSVLDNDALRFYDEEGRTIWEGGYIDLPDDTKGPGVVMRNKDGLILFSPQDGIAYLGKDGIPAELYVRSEQNLYPDNYIVSGLQIGQLRATTLVPTQGAGYWEDHTGSNTQESMALLSNSRFYATRFNLAGISGVTKAIMRLYLTKVPNSDNSLRIYRYLGDWSEETINGKNHPGYSLASLITVPAPKPGFYEVDVTSIVQSMISSGNYGFAIRSDNSFLTMQMATRKHSASAYRPSLTLTYGTTTDVSISPGWAEIGGTLRQIPDSMSWTPTGDGTHTLYLHYTDPEWVIDTVPGDDAVCLGKVIVSGGVVASVDMSAGSGRKSGFYDNGRLYGNWYYETPLSPMPLVTKGGYYDIPHNLGTTSDLKIEALFRKPGNFRWQRMATNGTSGCTVSCYDSNRLRVYAESGGAFYGRTDAGVSTTGDDAELKFIVIRTK